MCMYRISAIFAVATILVLLNNRLPTKSHLQYNIAHLHYTGYLSFSLEEPSQRLSSVRNFTISDLKCLRLAKEAKQTTMEKAKSIFLKLFLTFSFIVSESRNAAHSCPTHLLAKATNALMGALGDT